MDSFQIIVVVAGFAGVIGLGAIAYVFLAGPSGRQGEIRGMMAGGRVSRSSASDAAKDFTIEDIKRRSGSSSAQKPKEDIGTKLFKAGFYTAHDKKRFRRLQIIAPIVSTLICAAFMFYLLGNPVLTLTGIVLGLFIGFVYPMSWLDRQIRYREEDTLYFLPLVIEQVSIGVSSSLDIGPCVAQIVQMADERDSHNPVTEMFVHVEKLIRSGLNLEDSLVEVGEANGMTEVKHAFMFLAQCAKHGGEISKQLQELADSVMSQRQVQVEGRITALPVKATGPLATVFAGFFALLFAGLLVRLMSAFGA